MAFITSGEAMEGMYNISTPRNGTKYYWSTYRSAVYKQNNYITAWTMNTTNINQSWSHFRIIWVKNGTPVSGGSNASWYKILSVFGWQTDTIGTQGTGHYLAPCYGVGTYNANDADNSKTGTTFNWISNGNADCCLWAFYQRPSGHHCIVSYESWKNKNTTSFTGKVKWLLSEKISSTDFNNDRLDLAKWETISSNSWADTFAAWDFERREDCKVKAGSWKIVTQPWIKVNGTWHKVVGCYIKENDRWKMK